MSAIACNNRAWCVPFGVHTSVALGRTVKRAWAIEFVRAQLTSYGGLELLRHYFELNGLNRCVRNEFCAHNVGCDYGCMHLVLLMIGARRLPQLCDGAHDLRFARLCTLARIQTAPGGELAETVYSDVNRGNWT